MVQAVALLAACLIRSAVASSPSLVLGKLASSALPRVGTASVRGASLAADVHHLGHIAAAGPAPSSPLSGRGKALVAGDLLAAEVLAAGGALAAGDAVAGAGINLFRSRGTARDSTGLWGKGMAKWLTLLSLFFAGSVACCCCVALVRYWTGSLLAGSHASADLGLAGMQTVKNDIVLQMRKRRLEMARDMPEQIKLYAEGPEFKAKCDSLFTTEIPDHTGTVLLAKFKRAMIDEYGESIKLGTHFRMAFERRSMSAGRVNDEEFREMMMLFEFERYESVQAARRSPRPTDRAPAAE